MVDRKGKPLTREDVLKLVKILATTKEKGDLILSHDNVLKLIEENGGTAKELDLSELKFERNIDLHGLDLSGVILTKARLLEAHLEGAKLRKAHLEEANLRYVHLERAALSEAYVRGADLRDAHLEGSHLERADLRDTHLEKANVQSARLPEARLRRAQLQEANLTRAHLEEAILRWANLDGAHLRYIHLEGADLRDAHLEKADLRNAYLQKAQLQHAQLEEADLTRAHLEGTSLHDAEFSQGTKFVRVYWGDYIIGEEQKHQFLRAGDIYRRLKMWYTNAGIRDIAAAFYYREMESGRKGLKLFSKSSWNHRLTLELLRMLFGYGERWRRVLASIAVLILLFASAYLVITRFIPKFGTLTPDTFLHSLYYSAVSFTALGYGSWAPQPTGWIKGIGAFESLVGISMMALLLVTFFRKWTR